MGLVSKSESHRRRAASLARQASWHLARASAHAAFGGVHSSARSSGSVGACMFCRKADDAVFPYGCLCPSSYAHPQCLIERLTAQGASDSVISPGWLKCTQCMRPYAGLMQLVVSKRLLDIGTARKAANPAFYFSAAQNYGEALLDSGRHGAALKLLSELRKGAGAQTGLRYLHATFSCARAMLALGMFEQARSELQQLISQWPESLAPNHPLLAAAVGNLALASSELGDLDSAEKLLRDSHEMMAKCGGSKSADARWACGQAARVFALQGHMSSAEREFGRLLRKLEGEVGKESLPYAEIELDLSSVLVRRKSTEKCEEALRLAEHALSVRTGILRSEHPLSADALERVTRIMAVLGKVCANCGAESGLTVPCVSCTAVYCSRRCMSIDSEGHASTCVVLPKRGITASKETAQSGCACS
jgi:tetratricopeptide (TPR) repeat protein